MIKSGILALAVLFLMINPPGFAQVITVSGSITENISKESIPYVNIHSSTDRNGTTSNAYGFYSLRVNQNELTLLTFSHIGHKKIAFDLHEYQWRCWDFRGYNESSIRVEL